MRAGQGAAALLIASTGTLIALACGGFEGSQADSTNDAGAPGDAASGGDTASLSPDAQTLDCPVTTSFTADFEGATIEDGWSGTTDGVFLRDAGADTVQPLAGSRKRVEGTFTTPKQSLSLALTTNDKVAAAGIGLGKTLPWKGHCLRVEFDLRVPDDSRGVATIFSISPWSDGTRQVVLTMDAKSAKGLSPSIGAWQDAPLSPTGRELQPNSRVDVTRNAWYHATVIVRGGPTPTYAVALAQFTDAGPQELTAWKANVQTSVTASTSAELKLQLFGGVGQGAAQAVLFDSVKVYAQ